MTAEMPPSLGHILTSQSRWYSFLQSQRAQRRFGWAFASLFISIGFTAEFAVGQRVELG